MRLSKVNSHDGKQKYVIMPVKERGLNDKLSKVLKEGYISSMEASNLVVVKTATGMAMAVATALDAMELPGFACFRQEYDGRRPRFAECFGVGCLIH